MADLIDIYGNKLAAPKEGPSALVAKSTGSIRQLWSSSAGPLTPHSLAKMLREHSEGRLDRFMVFAEEAEEKNEHYGSVLGTRKRAVEGCAYSIKPGGDSDEDKEIAKFISGMVDSPHFPTLVEDMLDALGKGYSVQEIIWHTTSGKWFPVEFRHITPRAFQLDADDRRLLRLRDSEEPDGHELAPYKFLVHWSKLKSGDPHRSALARFVAWTYLFQNFTLKDWVGYVETYGQPVRVGRYGPSATEEQINELVRALKNIGTDAAAAIPDSMKLEFVNSAGTSDGTAYERLAAYCDKRISKAVLGQTMTADDGSSKSQAEVHDDVRTDIKRADVRKICTSINMYLIRPVVDLNFGPRLIYPKLVAPVLDKEDLEELRAAIKDFTSMGVRVPRSFVHERWGLPQAAEGEEVLELPSPATGSGPAPRLDTARARKESGEELVEGIIDDVLDDWEEVMGPIVDPVRRAIDTASSYDEAQANLEGAIEDMEAGALATRLRDTAMMGRAAGNTRN